MKLIVPVVVGSLLPLLAWCQPAGFDDEFSGGTLNPAWVLVPGCGSFSVTADPGFLQHSLAGCSSGVAGAELYRQFTGTQWTFDTKVTYSMFAGPGQNLYLNIFFGPPSANTFVTWLRHRDDGYGVNDLELNLIDGGVTLPGGFGFGLGPPPCPADTCFLRITRAGQKVSVLYSPDGTNFTQLDSQTFTTNLGNLQTVLLFGSSVFPGAYADYDYIRAGCPANVTLTLSGYGNTQINASFTPPSGLSLAAAAGACGFTGFNWQQAITVWPRPSPLCRPDTCLSAVAQPTFYLSAPPPFSDPYPNGGWVYELKNGYPNGDFSYPFYYNQNGEIALHEKCSQFGPCPPGSADTLLFSDSPADPDLLNSELLYGPEVMQFTTSLVGVNQGNQLGPVLFSWTWTSDFDGTVGGLLATKTDLTADPGSGTGGITITSINGVPVLPTISLWANTNIGLGQSGILPITLSGPAPAGGVTVTLTSSDPTKVTVTPSVFIPAGRTSSNLQPQVNGLNVGVATVSASAPGYTSTSQQVQVSASLSFALGTVTILAPATQALTLNLSGPAPAGGLTINLSSSNTGVATVAPTVTFPANATSVTVAITGVTGGQANILASSPVPALTSATVNVTVESTGTIIWPANATVGVNSSVQLPIALPVPAPVGGLTVTLTSGDPSRATVTPATVFIPGGATTPATQPQVNGVSAGSAIIVASAPGFISASVFLTIQ